jgi:hypothetical protein
MRAHAHAEHRIASRPTLDPDLHIRLQVAHLERREASLKEQVAQLDKKLNDMQRVYMKGVKSTVESIRASRAVLVSSGKVEPNSGEEADDSK